MSSAMRTPARPMVRHPGRAPRATNASHFYQSYTTWAIPQAPHHVVMAPVPHTLDNYSTKYRMTES